MKDTSDRKEIEEFIKLMQSLSVQEQLGLLNMVQGARLLAEPEKKKKQRT